MTSIFHNKTLAGAFLVAACCAGTTEAATYYVSPGGNNSNSCATAQSTTASSHKASIAAGVACAVAGDTVYIHGGTYTGADATIDSQGHRVNSGVSFTNAITISGYPGEIAIMQPPANVSAVRLTSGAPGYLIIQDLVMDMVNSGPGTTAEGVMLYTAHHIRMQRVDLKNGFGFGVHFGDDTPFNEILDSSIHGFGTANSAPGDGHALYITSSDNLFQGNDIYNNAGYGFHIYNNRNPHVDPCRNVIRNNRIHDNGFAAGSTTYGVVITWGDANQVYNNLIYANKAGVQLYTQSTNTLLANNTIYGNTNEAIALQYYGGGITVRNNIVYANGQNIIDYGGSGAPTVDHNLTTDPGFTNAAALDFRLNVGSAARDTAAPLTLIAGDYDGNSRPQGSGYDIGALEALMKQTLSAPTNLRLQ